ncbi:hypothetical protein J6TS2_50670 [Heyndrickxia sporothermodurans]|nr:hypothetical protein J6TS2_50670 [Heyndrickxia sporothermodurans]
MGGAFQTSREIFTNPIWQDIPKFRIFFYIVGNAVFSNEGVRVGGITLQRGQFLRSYRNLQSDLEYLENRSIKKYSLSLIKKKIDQLVKEERLKIEDTELGTLFTVVNYSIYQGFDNYKTNNENAERTEREQSENNSRTEQEQNENNNKKDNKDNKDKNDNKDNKKKSPKQVYDETSPYFKLSTFFFDKIKENNPDHRQPNLQTWSDEIRKIIEIDKRTIEQVKYLIKWVQEDEFEKVNVLSPVKLRKRFDQLVMKVKAQKKDKPNKPHYPKEDMYARSNGKDVEQPGNVRLFK